MKDVKNGIENIEFAKKLKRNLTKLENDGLKWCQKMTRTRKLYITKVDKGGSILILDAERVNKIILEKLEDQTKYRKMNGDPREEIKKEIKDMIKKYMEQKLITQEERFMITGNTKKDGMSHAHEFCMTKPYVYPLFKIHKLTEDMIAKKVIPPVRMVTSGVGGPTYRLGAYVNSILEPIVKKYCKGELVKNSIELIQEIKKLETEGG